MNIHDFSFFKCTVRIVPRGFTGKPRVGSRVNLAALKDNSRLLFSRSLSLRSSHLLAFDLRAFNFFGYFLFSQSIRELIITIGYMSGTNR